MAFDSRRAAEPVSRSAGSPTATAIYVGIVPPYPLLHVRKLSGCSYHGDQQRLRAADCGNARAQEVSRLCNDAEYEDTKRRCGTPIRTACRERIPESSRARTGRDPG